MINLQAIVSLDTGERTEQICIYEGDDVDILIQYFCSKHKIQEEGKQYIIQEIKKQLFQPKRRHISMLSLNSQKYVQKLIRDKKDENVYDQLYTDAENKKKRQQTIQNEYLQREQQNNYGIPQINSISKQIIKERNHSNDKTHDRLFQDAKNLIQKQGQLRTRIYSEKYPFQPQSDNSRRDSLKPNRQKQLEHADKLMHQNDQLNQKLQKQRIDKQQELFDQASNQEFFKPKINKNHIFKYVKKKTEKQDKQLAYLINNHLIKLKGTKSNSTSRERKVENNYFTVQSLFQNLDSDRDDLISMQFINLNVNEKQLKKIRPILNFIDEKNLEINFEQFFQLLNHFYIKLD